ncbi:MAG: kelch repeat-containing protein [Elusimicrobia bacterium]|nr:kelch repeat-containing protein [Elusimicrobiota bacterium]
MRRLSTALAAAFLLAALPSVSSAAVPNRRVAHTATLLTTGDLLIAGGVDETGATLQSADIFAASLGNVIIPLGVPGQMSVARASHTATLMSNGCVLVTGGNTAATDVAAPVPTNTAEIYNPATGGWTATANNMTNARYNHTATLLNDGRVLVCGGQDAAGTAVPAGLTGSCDLYTPTSCTAGTFAAAAPLQQARYNHTAVLLKDGKVWFAGGRNPLAVATGGVLVTTERYVPDPAGVGIGSFQSASPMIEARAYHTTTLMGDGKALVVGGYNKRDVLANKGITESAEIYDPVSNSVAPAAAMSARRQSHATALSANGEVTVFGGLGNITTTYVLGPSLNASGLTLDNPSAVTANLSGGVVAPTATITGGAGLLKLDYLLNKPVVGEIADGEMWLSSPSVHATWGMVNFTPASETVPGSGLHIDLAGVVVGCRRPFSLTDITGNCGNVQMVLPPGTISQMGGQIVFYRRVGVATTLSANTGGNLWFAPPVIDTTTTNGVLTVNTHFNTQVTIPMDKGLIGSSINSGTLTMTAGTIMRTSAFTVTLTTAVASTIGGPFPITADLNGDGEAIVDVNFLNVAGSLVYSASSGQLASGAALLPTDAAALTLRMTYTTTGANLSNESFSVDVATVVIRKMVFADSETYNPKANSWTILPAAGLITDNLRYGHSATLLPNNDKVFVGGRACSGATCATQTASASLGLQLLYYEKNFAATTGLAAQKRAFHTSTLLPGGDILIAGGTNGPSILSHAELFTPGTDLFSPVNGGMRYVRDLHTATLLPNGRVLIAGGFTTNATSTGSTNTAEIYYPDTKRFIETSPMISSRSNHTAIMLPNGQVFVAGGFGPGDVVTPKAEIFLSTESRWIPALDMPAGCERAIHATVQLKDGRILLIGGVNASGPLATVARYDPVANSWGGNCTTVAAMPTALRSLSATLLFDGRVLVAGGNDGLGEANKSYIYDPLSNTWTATDALPLLQPRFNHTATLLPNGTVMISGGSQRFGNVPTSIETFHINGSSWVSGGIGAVQFSGGARAFHTMTMGLNNKVYGIGGSDGVIGGTGVALYNTAEAGYFSATPDNFSKDAPPSFRQATISGTSATPFLPATALTVTGTRFRGGTEASGGGAASANSAFSFPHMILQQVDGSGGAASQSNGGFVVDLTTQIFLTPGNLATLDTSLTVNLPATSAALPYGWYTLRMGANDIYSDAKMVQVGPAKPTLAPANLTGVAAGISSMTWTWDPIAGVDGYNVYNATTGVFLSSIPISANPAPLLLRATFYQTFLDPSATTSILVAGYTLSGDGPLTASPTSYTLSTCPINVTIASVTFSDLLLYWGANGNSYPGTTYEVTQSSDNFVNDISTPVPKLFNQTTNFTTISNLAANTTYYFRVQAFNLVGLPSSYSAVVSTRTRAPVDQPTVSGRTTISIDWRWNDPGGVTNYRVYNATNGVFIAAPITNLFTEVNLGTNTEHSIRVTAVTSAGEGPLSPSASAYTAAATPGPFVPTVSAPTTGSFVINWTNNDNPLSTTYASQVTQFAANGSSVAVTTTTSTGLPFRHGYGNLIPSTRYGYELIALNGEGLESDVPAAVYGSTWTKPADPSIVLGSIATTPTTISFSWDANLNSSSATYEVTYTTADGVNAFITDISTSIYFAAQFGGTSATITGLVTGSTYTVRVLARNPFGVVSNFSNYVTTRTFNGGAPVGSLQGPLLASANSTIFGSLGNGRKVNLRAAAHTFPADVVVTMSSFVPTGTLCPNAANIAFSIVASPALQPIGSLYLAFDFLPADLAGIPANRALLMRYDPGSNTCVPLETVVDSAQGWMTARINHFSLFQVAQVPLSTTAETARVFPNPYYAGRDGYATIDNVPAGARVRIFTLRGEQVLDVKANSAGLLTWSGTNGSGRSVASGVYLVVVESGGTKKILKLAVIR